MRKAAVILISLTCTTFGALAEEKVFRKVVQQIIGTSQSMDDARIAAIAKAKREALEEAGTWVHSVSEVKNLKLVRDDVVAISMGITRTRVLDEQPFVEGRAVGIRVVAEVTVDNSGLAEQVRRYLADQERLAEKKAESAREAELLAKLAELEKRMAAMQAEAGTRPAGQEQALGREIQENSRKLAAQEAFSKGESYSAEPGLRIRYKDPRAAIAAFSEAIRLDPEYAEAYARRGRAYTDLGDHARALEDVNRAIQLNPNIMLAYAGRAKTHLEMGNYELAVADATEAIRRLPNMPNAYTLRGRAYDFMGQHDRAIADLDRAIQLDPSLPNAYAARATARRRLGNTSGAREDDVRACELGFQNSCRRLRSRGMGR